MSIFSQRKPDVVTLLIEGDEIRYAATKGGQVDKWGVESIVPELYADGVITNPADLGQQLDQLFEREKLDRKHVVSAVSGLRAIPRMLTLPKLQASMLEGTIQREARKEMPVSLDDLYISWQMMQAQGDMQRVYMLGVPKTLIDTQVNTLKAANITPYLMDLKPLALVRAVAKPEAIIVNLEDHSLDIILVSDHIPGIMRSFSLSREPEAQQVRVRRMIDELVQTIRFYNDSHPGSPLQPTTSLNITGKALADPSTVDALREALERPIERPPAPIGVPVELPMEAFMTNLGLALKKAA